MRDLEDEKRIKAYIAAKMTHIKMYNECMNLADGLDVAKFAELVRADEREACAMVCLEGTDMPVQVDALKIIRAERKRIANAIRARGEKPLKREWVGLTDEEIGYELTKEFGQWWSRHVSVCRAIEAKLKEKNNG